MESTLYPKITNRITDVLRDLDRALYPNVSPRIIPLVGTVKLHGTHADIVIRGDNSIALQSRNRTSLSLEADNYKFAQFMWVLQPQILNLKQQYHARYTELNPGGPAMDPEFPLIIAGEWIGQGIQTGVAIAQLSPRFVIVSAAINGSWLPDNDYADIHNEATGIYNISRGGFFHNYLDRNDVEASKEKLQVLANDIEKKCPFGESFGIHGVGEGVVWKLRNHSGDPKFWFKVKGPKFSTSSMPKMSKIQDPTVEGKKAQAREFTEAIVTARRLEQGLEYLEEMGVNRDQNGMGVFLKWVVNDCLTEEKREMQERGIGVKMLSKEINSKAKAWYSKKL
ncbi:MAG: hypothetical protein M1834_005591 [Cirrosporium novae-zelandiae]|nr:MAG: hypothetical protein M1834_005591 [Cirrosporium novae-zelandiae]